MDSERWDQLESLFTAALERDPGDRAAFLDEACGSDADLRGEVEALLNAHEDSHVLAVEGRLLAEHASPPPDPDALLGARIGTYRVKRHIGHGGMSDVYLAERDDDQYRQEVALKVIRPGFHHGEIVRRFRTERQILARLVHPHIARLLDGGVTDDGRPYLVLPYIDGAPITRFCDRHRLSINDRLRLFRTVCAAVQYAHRNLIVHRDLKPSNILVTEDGEVKLLDFGIAKLLDPHAVDVSLAVTRSEIRLMTPEYAAPEQVRGEAVTTATDVYALGMLLYELLTGHRPYRLPGRIQTEIERIICEEEPTRPSTVVSNAVEVRTEEGTMETWTPEQVSAVRRVPLGRLRRLLQGDLDNIVMMALRKEPEHRYASAAQLAEDVDRFLGGQPVIARKHTLGYRARRFVRRNRMGVAVVAGFGALLLGFSLVTAGQARTVARERDFAQAQQDKAEQIVQVLVTLFETSDPTKVPGGDTLRVGDFLERGQQAMLDDLADQPDVQARMKQVLGTMYRARSQYDRARPLLEEALAQQRGLKGPNDPDAAAMLHDLANLTRVAGDRAVADSLLRASLALHRALYGEAHPDVAQGMQDLAAVTQDDEEKQQLLHDALAMRRMLLPADHEDIAASLNQLAIYYFRKGDFGEASRLFRETLDLLTPRWGEAHPHVLSVMGNLAATYSELDRLEEAEAIHLRVLALQRTVLGPETMPVAVRLSSLGNVRARRGDYAGAEAAFRDAYALWGRIVGGAHWRTANDARNLAVVLHYQGRYKEAQRYLLEALAINTRARGVADPSTVYMRGQLGLLLLDLGRPGEALQTERDALRLIETNAPEQGHYIADVQVWLGRLLIETGTPAEAEALLHAALAYRQETLPAAHPKIGEAQCVLGGALVALDRYAEAEVLLREGFPVFTDWGLAHPRLVAQTRQALAKTYTALGEPEKAAAYIGL